MMPRHALLRTGLVRLARLPLLLAVIALLAAPLAWTAQASGLEFAAGICHADAGAGQAPGKSTHQHDGCSQCKLAAGLDLPAAVPPVPPGGAWRSAASPAPEASVIVSARFAAYASRAPPRLVGA